MNMDVRGKSLRVVIFFLLAAAGCAPFQAPSLPTSTARLAPSAAPSATALPIPTAAPSATALPSPSAAPSATVTPSPSAAPLPAASPTPDSIHPILAFAPYESPFGMLLGAAQGGSWLSADDTAARLEGGVGYTLYSAQAAQGSAVGGAPVDEPICPSFWSIPIEHPAGLAAGIGADWNALPRVPVEMDVKDPAAAQLVRDFLTAQGFSQPQVQILRILQADLEGDGIQEQVVAASRFVEETGHDVTPGDYSLILLYREGQAALPVAAEWYTRAGPLSFPDRFGLAALLDLNGDGRLEILVSLTGWEKTGALVYTVDGDMLEDVLQVRCP